MRPDLRLTKKWVPVTARVLDLGCGDGALLAALKARGQARALGVEIDPGHISTCLRSGLDVVEQDLNSGLGNFGTGDFDVVVMAHSLQTMRFPHHLIDEMLRIGREAIVSFPNFGHWQNRWQLLTKGRMPVSRYLPYNWYDTPNIHFFTVDDFEQLCRDKGIAVANRAMLDTSQDEGWLTGVWPNLFAQSAVYHLRKA